MLEKDERFVRDLDRVHQIEAAFLPVTHERRGQLEQQRQQADVLRLHARKRFGGLDGVLLGQLERAETRDAGDGQLHAGFLDHQARADDFIGGFALVDAAQHLIRAGFQTQINHFETKLVQHIEVLLLFAQDGRRGAVARDTLALGEQLADVAQDFRHVLGAAHQRVTVREENAVNAAVHAACFIEIRLDVLDFAHAEALFLVHIAERALVVAASDGDLNDQAVRLGRRTEYTTFVFKHSFSS